MGHMGKSERERRVCPSWTDGCVFETDRLGCLHGQMVVFQWDSWMYRSEQMGVFEWNGITSEYYKPVCMWLLRIILEHPVVLFSRLRKSVEKNRKKNVKMPVTLYLHKNSFSYHDAACVGV